LGHPLLGDDTYGPGFKTKAVHLTENARKALQALGRQALHAHMLGFQHPKTGDVLRFQSRLPGDLSNLRHSLAGGAAGGRQPGPRGAKT
jgi:23S rRNA pseudouridine1911/1915/1917 synthase